MNKHEADRIFFKENIEPYYGNIVKFLLRASSDTELAGDMAQATMESAWKYRDKLKSYDNTEAALITIAKNNLKKYYLKHPPQTPWDELADFADERQNIEEIVATAGTAEALKKAVCMLDEKYRRILILHYYHKIPLKEIAEMYGENHNTILSRHTRSLKKLKEYCMKNEIL